MIYKNSRFGNLSLSIFATAGGARMAIESKAIQYLVREPYGWPAPRYRLDRGFAKKRIGFPVNMTDAAIWIDGNRACHDLSLGDRVILATGACPISILGYDDRRRRELFG